MRPEFVIIVVIGLPVICGTLIALTAMFFSHKKRMGSTDLAEEETQIMQEMHQSLIRMEKRIDSLETIYFELDRKKDREKL